MVTHHEVVVRGNRDVTDWSANWFGVRPGFFERLAIHVDRVSLGGEVITRKPDDSFHEHGRIA